MGNNRRRHANFLPVATIATWIVIALFVCGGGLYYVYCKNELHQSGAEIASLEKELSDLKSHNEGVQARIARATATAEFIRRRKEEKGFLADYVEIDQANLFVIEERPSQRTPYRPVANPQK